MAVYFGNSKDVGLVFSSAQAENQAILTILNVEELHEMDQTFSHYKELLHSMNSIQYCKVEVFRDCILGTLRIPQKGELCSPLMTFGFYLSEKELFFIEDKGDLKKWIEGHMDRLQNVHSTDELFLQFMEQLIENDILYLSQFENEMEDIEDVLEKKVPADFFAVLTKYRRKLSEMNAYYEQLTAIGELIQSHDSFSMVTCAEAWERYTLRTERLHDHVHLLQENVLQLRELYQSQQDSQQNKVMCILTVVTTLFLPLTLLTGWYGMNFVNMPELSWKYGYLVVILVAALTVVLEIIYFKKKKFF